MNDETRPEAAVEAFREDIEIVRSEVSKMIVGQETILDGVLTCLLAGGQVLLEGVPGLGKTMMVRTLADALQLRFSRIQFTPDLMPADILGTTVMTEAEDGTQRLEFRPGPIFAHIVLADEVNRATPKTQSALLEVMQEHSVTIGSKTHQLEEPYFVLATQNPLEMEGTYPLPEAQLDRFMFKLLVDFPTRADLHDILDRTTTSEKPEVRPVLDRERILTMRSVARDVAVAHHVKDYVIRALQATHPEGEGAPPMVKEFVRYGASPRGAQAALLAAKIRAVFDGRFSASIDDVRWAIKPAFRHRLILNFQGEAEGVAPDAILDQILQGLPESAD